MLFTVSATSEHGEEVTRKLTNQLRRNLEEEGDSNESSSSTVKSTASSAQPKPPTATTPKSPTAPKKAVTPIRKKGPTVGEPSKVPPKVFILGVQKGGSSSMMWMLIMHPQLCSGERKEVRSITLNVTLRLLDINYPTGSPIVTSLDSFLHWHLREAT
jgi:hypothetical protein